MNARSSAGSKAVSAVPAADLTPPGWRISGPIFVVSLIAIVIANGDALWALVKLWAFAGLEYGFVVVAASGWFIWTARERIRTLTPSPSWRALLLLLPLGAVACIAYLVDVRLVQLALFVIDIGVLTWAVLGFQVFRAVAYPISLLALALPIWNYFQPVLQYMTVQATAFAIRCTGMPVFVDDTAIWIPHGTILVLARCSGSQFFQAGVTLGAIHAYSSFRSAWARVGVITFFVAMSVIGNWVRVLALIVLGKLTDFQHLAIGWGIFTIFLIPSFAFGLWIQKHDDASPSSVGPVPPIASTAFVMGVAVTAVALLISGPLTEKAFAAAGGEGRARLAPMAVRTPWSGPYQATSDWRPAFHQTHAESLVAYRAPGLELIVYRGYYDVQRQDGEVVNELNQVFDSTQWEARGGHAGTEYRAVAVDSKTMLRVIETRLQQRGSGEDRVVWHWYSVAGQDVAEPWHAKLAQVSGIFKGRRDAMIVALSTTSHDVDAARSVLAGFIASNYEALGAMESNGALARDGS